MTIQKHDRLQVDANGLRRKYREERDRRLRREGNEQYVEMTGQFACYLSATRAMPLQAKDAD